MNHIKIAVIRIRGHELFGKYTDAINRLRELGEVSEIRFNEIPNQYFLARSLRGYGIVITEPMAPIFGEEFFELNNDVKMIYVSGRGYDNINVSSANKAGVLVARVPGFCEAEAVAEYTVALLLMTLRKIRLASKYVESGDWFRRGYLVKEFMSRRLSDLVVGVIGFGWIGSRVAEILSRGFGVKRILVYDPYIPELLVRDRGFIYVRDLRELLSEADAILIHADLNQETYHMISRKEFELMKNNVVIVNTARGAIIDTEALVEFLRNGKVAGAGLDVVENEPIDKNHPLLQFDNVVVTPHVAFDTIDAIECIDNAVVEGVKSFLLGQEVVETVAPERYSSTRFKRPYA